MRIRQFMALMAALIFAGPCLLAATSADLAALKRPALAPSAVEVKDWTFTQGHCVYTLTGRVAGFSLGNTPSGFYFKGEGRFRFTTGNRMEFPVAIFNLKQNSFVKPEVTADSLVVGDALEEAIFLFSPGTQPQLPGVPGTLSEGEFRAQWDYFQSVEERPFQHKLMLRALKSTPLPYFHAQLRTKSRAWTHTLDPMDSEDLEVLHPRMGDWGIWSPWAKISRQPIGWDYRAPKAPRFVLTDLDLELVASAGTAARMTIRETYLPLEDGLQALDLDFNTRLEGINHTGSTKIQQVIVRAVKDASGQNLAFEHSSQGILVALPSLKANTPVTLTFEVEGDPLVMDERASYWVLGTWPWFPMPREFSGQAYTVHATVKTPQAVVPIMGGTTIRRVKEGDMNVLETRFDKPVQFFSIIGGKFVLKEEVRNGITFRVAGYVTLGDGGDKLLKVAPGVVAYYESVFGPFPFKELNLVEMQYVGGGQSPPGVVFLGTEAFNPTANITMRLYAAGNVNQLVAHEISHQYWGQLVKMWSPEDQWITEAFAEYSSLLAVMNMKNKGKDEYENTVKEWFRMAQVATEFSPIPLANSLAPQDDFLDGKRYRPFLIYYKGACLLHAIHKELGDEKFVRFLRSYVKTLSWQHSTTAHIPMILKALTGKDYTKFMDDYYYGLAMPPMKF